MYWLVGALIGLLGALPGLRLAHDARSGRRVSVAAGLAVTLASTLMLVLAATVGYYLHSSEFASFAFAMATVFLGTWTIEAVLAWRWIVRGRRQ